MAEDDEEKKEEEEETLESSIDSKLEHTLDDAMHKFIGITINELKDDLGAKLKKPWILSNLISQSHSRKRKRDSEQEYFRKLLLLNFGNVSEVARIAGKNRRSIHRLINDAGIDVDKIRHDMMKQYDIKQKTVNHIIENVLDTYKQVIHPDKLQDMYRNVGELSAKLIDDLPEDPQNLDLAEDEFERQYIVKALTANGNNISKTAKAIGLRFETLHRKMKTLGIKVKDNASEEES